MLDAQQYSAQPSPHEAVFGGLSPLVRAAVVTQLDTGADNLAVNL
jgi:hypothetical protein